MKRYEREEMNEDPAIKQLKEMIMSIHEVPFWVAEKVRRKGPGLHNYHHINSHFIFVDYEDFHRVYARYDVTTWLDYDKQNFNLRIDAITIYDDEEEYNQKRDQAVMISKIPFNLNLN